MKKEQVLDLMSAIPPDLVEEADLQAPAKRHLPRAVRTGLIAACLCLALLGTAFATNPEAAALILDRLSVWFSTDGERVGYVVIGEAVQYPLDSFSPALDQASGRRGIRAVVSKKFSAWDEVQAFLGEKIPCAWPNDGKDWSGAWKIDLIHTQIDQLWGVQVCSTDPDLQAAVCFFLYTENCPWADQAPVGLYNRPDTRIEQLDAYPMANGCLAEIVMDYGEEDRPKCTAIGHFTRDGILYRVDAFGALSSPDETAARLQTILDSFP